MGLHVRRADAAPGVGVEEYFGRLGESVISDRDCSDEAKVLLAAVYLDMAVNRNPRLSMATNHELADLVGKTERTVTRRISELEARGHLSRERVRSIAGSPRGLRPLGKLRGVRQPFDPSPVSRCDPSLVSMHLDTCDGEDRRPCRADPSPVSAPLKREGEDREEQQQIRAGDSAPVVVVAPSSTIVGRIADVLSDPETFGEWKSPGGPSGQIPPGAESRDTVPDAKQCTTQTAKKSRRELGGEHKGH